MAWRTRGRGAEDAPAVVAGARTATTDAPPAGSPPLDAGPGDPARSARAGSTAPEQRFAGRGTIRGQVTTRVGVEFPERWTLTVEPSPWLEGRERAASRKIGFEHGERDFRVEDLPLAGYVVRARAIGLDSLPCSVLLVKGSDDQFVTAALMPTGFIDGAAIDHFGRPAEGLDVTLESVSTKERRTLTTDAAGSFVFRDVLDGEYRLAYGRPDAPLLPPDQLAFRAPTMRVPTRTLPRTGRMRITVVDGQGRPLPRCTITGFASGGGTIEAFTDDEGKADARFLFPGKYRIDARTEDKKEGSVTAELAPEQELDVGVIVRR